LIQRLIEKANDLQKLQIIETIAPHIAIGVHKNGTWVYQKMIDHARTQAQVVAISDAAMFYVPALLLDQFGNYVVQCCLRFGSQRNQFIFDAMQAKTLEIGLGRFGARAMRTCLESQYANKRQQKQVAVAIIENAVQLIMNPNGAILVNWLLDTSGLSGRYTALAPQLVPHLGSLCRHKLASAFVLKIGEPSIEIH
jgi:hypothetical protein